MVNQLFCNLGFMITNRTRIILVVFFFMLMGMCAQEISGNSIIPFQELSNYLKPDIKKSFDSANISSFALASYMREKFSERYFYDWKTFQDRFEEYNKIYPQKSKSHLERANDHMGKFPATAQWKLPFDYLNGDPVNAYALRHLARQHKMIDIAYQYHYSNKDTVYVSYFKRQMQSLNTAFKDGSFEKIEDGNGVYEAFRSGYRVLNWFRIHTMFLGADAYQDKNQLVTIATLLQHGAHLYENNSEFQPGNHQTRGLSALAMISILLRDFKGTEKWYDHSMKLLGEHLKKEINEDGFQFERSVHYHMSDIGNYYYVYQLSKISAIPVDSLWENKLNSLFTTLAKIGYPDTSAPVLQDDTDEPWAEKNDISGALTLGYLLFENPTMGYFATNSVEPDMYWYLSENQLKLLKNIQREKPEYTSLTFPDTGYFVMREGWELGDKMMIISAGLDADKPDHQHGDMLGIQAMANSRIILPNYQVRYPLDDLELFKNSWVKNVALVDDELQGKEYTSNKGGSGFGKFRELPSPKTIAWGTNDAIDVFVGSHDGFENVGVDYSRQVIYLKDDFWLVKDNFKSDRSHTYRQVWQGHYSMEHSPDLLRSSFDNGSGCDILQLIKTDSIRVDGRRGKEWAFVNKKAKGDFSFITAIYPFDRYDNRIDETLENSHIKGWELNSSDWKASGTNVISFTKELKSVFFLVDGLTLGSIKIGFSQTTDVYLKSEKGKLFLQSLGDEEVVLSFSGLKGLLVNGATAETSVVLKPGDELEALIAE